MSDPNQVGPVEATAATTDNSACEAPAQDRAAVVSGVLWAPVGASQAELDRRQRVATALGRYRPSSKQQRGRR